MIEIARQEIADIPCLVLRETRVSEAPVVIHYHGWTGDKGSIERPDQSLVQLASAGFMVVAPDCYEHGERRTDAWFRAQLNGWAFVCEAMTGLAGRRQRCSKRCWSCRTVAPPARRSAACRWAD